MDRLSVTPNTTFEFALWCKLLRDRGYTGMQVARQLGKSEGYVNNLVRILDRASLPILQRWCDEQRPSSGLVHVCATDWLMQVCVLPHAEQDVALAERIARLSRPPSRPPTDPGQRAACATTMDTRVPTTVDAPDPPSPLSVTDKSTH